MLFIVIQFADGHSYSKAKLEDALRTVLERPTPAKAKAPTFKKEDIELLVCTRNKSFSEPR